jgi:hypothetical protein
VLYDLLISEEAVEANYSEADFISDMEIHAQVSVSLGKGPCDHPNAQHDDQGTNLCHFWGSFILQLYNLVNAAILLIGLAGRLIQIIIPCIIQLGVKICLGEIGFWGGVRELLTCALCAICKAFLPDFFCNWIGDIVGELVEDGASALQTETQFYSRIKAPVVKAYQCFGRNISEQGSHEDHKTFGDDMRGDSGACGLIFKALSDLFSHMVGGDDSGGGNGSNQPDSPGCKPAMDGYEKIFSLILRLFTHTFSCVTCLYDAVTSLGGGSGSGSGKKKKRKNPFEKGLGQKVFGIMDAINKLHTMFCCLTECSCWYSDITCSSADDDFPEKEWPDWVAPTIEHDSFKAMSASKQNAFFKAHGLIPGGA